MPGQTPSGCGSGPPSSRCHETATAPPAAAGGCLDDDTQPPQRITDGDRQAPFTFCQEVRRHYPPRPSWRRPPGTAGSPGVRLSRWSLVVIDVYGTLPVPHGHEPDAFRPERFFDIDVGPDVLVTQGGGEVATGHVVPRPGRRPVSARGRGQGAEPAASSAAAAGSVLRPHGDAEAAAQRRPAYTARSLLAPRWVGAERRSAPRPGTDLRRTLPAPRRCARSSRPPVPERAVQAVPALGCPHHHSGRRMSHW